MSAHLWFRVAVCLSLSPLAWARAIPPALPQIADAVVEVRVTDESGRAVPGVRVTVLQTETGLSRVAITSESGEAEIPAVPPAGYEVKFELTGFTTITQKTVLHVGETGRLDVQMKVASISETISVTADAVPLVDVYKTDSSTNIVPEQIESLPVPDRDFQRLAFLAPGVQRERGGFRFIGGGPVIGSGGNASQSTILVDGIDFTDPTLGLARARFSQDAIQEFRVIANRFDAEIGGSAGGALSVVTKSGTNTWKGTAFGFFRAAGLRAKGTLDLKKNPYSRQQYGFTSGGPLQLNRTHFFASFERINENDVALFRPGGAFQARAADIKTPVDQSLMSASVNHAINQRQVLRVRAVYERFRQANFRVGGLGDESSGMHLNRDNWNLTGTHSWALSARLFNQLSLQTGQRKFQEPNNSTALSEYFSSGNTLITGANIVGDQSDNGRIFEVRDVFFMHFGNGRRTQHVKAGGSWQRVRDSWDFPLYPRNVMFYAGDARALPIIYVDARGAGAASIGSHLLAGFVQDDFHPSSRLTVSASLRYDIDTNGNNPHFTSNLQPSPRGRDTNNFQPRSGFTYDITGEGNHVVRGGAGMFTGRFLLVPALSELQLNGFTGRIVQQRLSGLLVGLPTLAIDPANPATTGIALPRDAIRLDDSLVSPWSVQSTLGYTMRLPGTRLFADVEGVYVKGHGEIIVRDKNFRGNTTGGRINPAFNQINTYTNEGRSEYKALVLSLNGTVNGKHLIASSLTIASKKNINDDFSPALTDYPNDPANIQAEYGRSRVDERYRFVTSAVLRIPYRFTLAPIFEYGSGQPWNHRLGYDFNGDGKFSDRPAGIRRFSEDGPNFASLSMRLTHRFPLGDRPAVELIGEGFNLFNRTNYDPNSIINAEFLSGPTLAVTNVPLVPNPRFRKFTSALPAREFQLGVRVTF